jgi:hypothetical protein
MAQGIQEPDHAEKPGQLPLEGSAFGTRTEIGNAWSPTRRKLQKLGTISRLVTANPQRRPLGRKTRIAPLGYFASVTVASGTVRDYGQLDHGNLARLWGVISQKGLLADHGHNSG